MLKGGVVGELRLVGDHAGGVEHEGLADQLLPLAPHERRVGAVDKGEATVRPVAADQVDLVLHDAAVTGLDPLEIARHPLDLTGEPDDLVMIGLVRAGVGLGVQLPGLRRLGGAAEGADPIDQRAVPDIAGEQQQNAADHREAQHIIGRPEAIAEVVIGDDDTEGNDQGGRERKQEYGLAVQTRKK